MNFDLNILDEYVEKGLLRKAEDEDLVQYNYSDMCNNESCWDEITLFNRGNIYEKKTGKLIAKSMPKFMNFEQLPGDSQNRYLKRTFTCTEKLDGCLGIIYKYKGQIRCNSRGSFDNYVTDVMKRLLPNYVLLNHLLEYNTLNVEVISPETKIICNYGDTESLNLITSYNSNTWLENTRWSNQVISDITYIPIVQSVTKTWDELLQWKQEADWQKEGFVLCFDNGNDTYDRIKVKSNDYLRVAAFKANLNIRCIWKTWKIDLEQHTNKLTEFMNACPDELIQQCKDLYNQLVDMLNYHKQNVYDLNKQLLEMGIVDMKSLGLYFKQHKNKYMASIFALRKYGKDCLDKYLIKMIEPKAEEDSSWN